MLTYEEQLDALAALVEDWAVKRDKAVKGLFTSGDFVTFRLSQIFTPAGWHFIILDGPTVVILNEISAYVRLVGRLKIRFANGEEVFQDDIGIWPLKATNARNGGVLRDTAPERYETAEKAARTDCLKNAARNLGTCFAPLTDLELLAHIKRQAHLKGIQDEDTNSAEEDVGLLFGGDDNNGPPLLSEKPPGPQNTKAEGNGSQGPTETPQGAISNSKWHTRGDLVYKASKEIAYYKNPKHILATLCLLEDAGDIDRDMDDETVFAKLNAYATRRADEKAAAQAVRS